MYIIGTRIKTNCLTLQPELTEEYKSLVAHGCDMAEQKQCRVLDLKRILLSESQLTNASEFAALYTSYIQIGRAHV